MPSKTIVYLSGPMSGIPDYGFPTFDHAASLLRSLGYRVINPADNGAAERHTWADCVARDLALLPNVNVVAQLPGWESSRGARIEALVAREFGIEVVPLDQLVWIGRHAPGKDIDMDPGVVYCASVQSIGVEGSTPCQPECGRCASATGASCPACSDSPT